MSMPALGVTAAAIARELGSWPRRQLTLAELQALLLVAEPALEHAPERRARLHEVLDELVDASLVRLPSERSYDRSAKPVLPRFVRIDRPARAPRRISGAVVAWRPELAWATELSFDERTLSDLRAINAFLRDRGGERPVVPLRERSLHLFGHEKRLEALMGGQLFFPDRLTLQQLRCEEIHPPFVFETIGPASDVLVVENHHSFVSLCRVLPRDGNIGVVVYGAGAHFRGSVTCVADLRTRPRRVLYFGDLDIDGLDIPVHASALAAKAGLPAVESAVVLYRLLLDHGRPTPVENPPSRYRVRQLTLWLHADVRAAAAAVLADGKRLAQEWVGAELMGEHRALLRSM
ncbi:MAG: Wadjet anti-phage system protein JetD domain-containing protein [Solirubrobacteraceae bacterium]